MKKFVDKLGYFKAKYCGAEIEVRINEVHVTFYIPAKTKSKTEIFQLKIKTKYAHDLRFEEMCSTFMLANIHFKHYKNQL